MESASLAVTWPGGCADHLDGESVALLVFAIVASVIRLDSKGPVFYRAERIGVDREPFGMIKFRSLMANADTLVATSMAQNDGAGLLLKVKEGPRATRVGHILRRLSIDELPQLINVIRGDMRMVDPHPPMRREVEAYDARAQRRLLVRPGTTGLSHLSRQSDLSGDESVRLNLFHVENRSRISDVLMTGKTVKAVLVRDAYKYRHINCGRALGSSLREGAADSER